MACSHLSAGWTSLASVHVHIDTPGWSRVEPSPRTVHGTACQSATPAAHICCDCRLSSRGCRSPWLLWHSSCRAWRRHTAPPLLPQHGSTGATPLWAGSCRHATPACMHGMLPWSVCSRVQIAQCRLALCLRNLWHNSWHAFMACNCLYLCCSADKYLPCSCPRFATGCGTALAPK